MSNDAIQDLTPNVLTMGEPVSPFGGIHCLGECGGGGKCPAARLICAHMNGTSEGQMLGERIVPMVGDALTNPTSTCAHICLEKHKTG